MTRCAETTRTHSAANATMESVAHAPDASADEDARAAPPRRRGEDVMQYVMLSQSRAATSHSDLSAQAFLSAH